MRISDSMLVISYLSNLQSTKAKLEKLQAQVASQTKINRPSDSPSGTAKILRLENQLSSVETYLNNVHNAVSFINETTYALESIHDELTKVSISLAELNNSAITDYTTFADKIDLALNSILDLSNHQFDGKYIFGGTDFSGEPFGLSADQLSIEVKTADVSGKQFMRTSPNALQKINMTGSEIFGTIIKQSGNLDVNAANGSVHNNTATIYDSSGNEYDLNITFTKTGDNTYNFSYDILDSGGTSIFGSAPAAVEVVFNPDSGTIETIDGNSTQNFRINIPSDKIDFTLNFSTLTEINSATVSSFSANQKVDIFNALISIRDSLRAGEKPTKEQQEFVEDFSSKILSKTVEIGNITNQLTSTEELLNNQQLVLTELISKEKEVDVAKAIIDLQNYDYALQLTYKMSAMTLPKSLLDYL